MSDDELQEISRSWQKVERHSKTIGLRDGLADGSDSVFQKGFDDGFRHGFRNGFLIGKYEGHIKAKAKQTNQPVEHDELLEKASRGWCQMCNEDFSTKTIPEVENQQADAVAQRLQQLVSKYGELN